MSKQDLITNTEFRHLFENLPGQYLVLLPDTRFTIIAATDSYIRVTMTNRSEILNRGFFEIFPDNPNDPHANGVNNLTASFNRVIQSKVSDRLHIQKYDIRRPDSEGGGFAERYWSPVNTPVLNSQGEVQYIIYRVEDVTEIVKLQNWGVKQSERAFALQMKTEEMKSEMQLREKALQLANEKLRLSQELSRSLTDGINECFKPISYPLIDKQKERILIIEDDLEQSKALVKFLEPYFLLETANNGTEGLQKAMDFKPHLILCELELPQMSGPEVLRYLRLNHELESTLFILLTPKVDNLIRRQFYQRGIQDYLLKPFQNEDLFARIQNLLTIRKVQDLSSMDGVLENALDCVIGVNSWGTIISWNSQAEKTFGWTKEEAIGLKLVETIIPPAFRDYHEKSFHQFLKLGYGKNLNRRLELSALRKEGTEFPIELSVTPVRTKDSFIFYGFIRDITERVRTLEQLQLAKGQAESANNAKSNFLANMSHEIRTPLAAILGFSELLSDSSMSVENKVQFSRAIKRNGELLLNLINEILDLSKVESGKFTVDLCHGRLHELIYDVLSVLKLKASEKGIKIIEHYGANLPKVIRTDPLRLKQILLNIIGNAVKFTSQGVVEIHIEKIVNAQGEPRLSFCVKDTGMGISQEEQGKLFQPFSQIDNSSTRQFGGTGLGLALSKRFAQLLGGDVVLSHSIKGQGSTFTITIDPGPIQGQVEMDESASQLTSTALAEDKIFRIDGVRVLLAEDSLDNQFLISQILKKAGASVEIAENGRVALDKAQQGNYDIYLIDIQMPVMDGYSTIAELRKNGFKTPVIALTANALQGDRERSLFSGFNEHISKPVNREALINVIYKYCVQQNGSVS